MRISKPSALLVLVGVLVGVFLTVINISAHANDFQYPFKNGTKQEYISFGFGDADFGEYSSSWNRRHLAHDVWSPTGTKIYAIADGVVKISDDRDIGLYGNCDERGYVVVIEHQLSDGTFVTSLSGHVQFGAYDQTNETGLVPAGSAVVKGQYIATVADYWQDLNENDICGDTGDANWDHLHFGIRIGAYVESEQQQYARYIRGPDYSSEMPKKPSQYLQVPDIIAETRHLGEGFG